MKKFYLSHLLCICPSLFETHLNKANYIIYENSEEFLASQVSVLRRNNTAPTPVLLTRADKGWAVKRARPSKKV